VAFRTITDFLELTIIAIKDVENDKREYSVSMLLPRKISTIAKEDIDDLGQTMSGGNPKPRTKPARVNATLTYAKDGAGWKFADAFITHIETAK
jgi:hypothetical protein